MLGVLVYEIITEEIIRRSFSNVELWPMSFELLNQLAREHAQDQKVSDRAGAANGESIVERMVSVRMRKADSEMTEEAKRILQSEKSQSRGLQKQNILLQEHKTVNSILVQAGDGARVTKVA